MGMVENLRRIADPAGDSVRLAISSIRRPPDRIRAFEIEAASPHRSPRSAKYDRISKKVDAAYERGDFDLAERWDARLEDWTESADEYAAGLEDGVENAAYGGIEDAGTGLSGYAAEVYGQMLRGTIAPEDLLPNITSRALEDFQASPQRAPSAAEVMEFAKQMHEQRQMLKSRISRDSNRQGAARIDYLIRRLGED